VRRAPEARESCFLSLGARGTWDNRDACAGIRIATKDDFGRKSRAKIVLCREENTGQSFEDRAFTR